MVKHVCSEDDVKMNRRDGAVSLAFMASCSSSFGESLSGEFKILARRDLVTGSVSLWSSNMDKKWHLPSDITG